MKHDVYDSPDAERLLFDEAPEVARPDATWFTASMSGETGERPGWSACRAENHVMLVQLGYAQRRSAAGGPDAARWAAVAARLREDVVTANLALLVAIVGRFSVGDFEDRVSHASAALARAAESFDPFRGFAFSTYASVVMRRALASWARKKGRRRTPSCPGDLAMSLGDGDRALAAHRAAREAERAAECEEERAERLRDAVARAGLTPDEQHVLSRRLSGDGKPAIFAEIARELGLTKERARQVHEGALAKVRAAYEIGSAPPEPSPRGA